MSGMLDVVTFVHYRVFASKQTGENEAFYQRGSVGGHALTNNLRNVLFLAVYLFSHKDLRSKIEQNVSVSLLSYVRDNFIIVPMVHCDEADLYTVSALVALSSVASHTSFGQRSEDGCFLQA